MSGLNAKGKVAGLIGRLCGFRLLQPVYDYSYQFFLLCMNIGSATYAYAENGETYVMRMIRDRLAEIDTSSPVIFDVGAHRGYYALNLAEIFGTQSCIYCFEPSASLFADLKANLGEYPNFRLYQLGLSDKDEAAKLYDDGSSIPTMLPETFDLVGGQIVSTETIKTVRLDQFCQKQEVERINFLKVDVEGQDLKALEGAGEFLRGGKIDFVQFEFGPQSIGSRSFFYDFYKLLSPNYDLYRILRKGLYRLGSYQPKHEIFLSATNYLAIRKSRDI